MAAVKTLRLPTADELEVVLEAASALGCAVGGVRSRVREVADLVEGPTPMPEFEVPTLEDIGRLAIYAPTVLRYLEEACEYVEQVQEYLGELDAVRLDAEYLGELDAVRLDAAARAEAA